jgi:hypothetical protein
MGQAKFILIILCALLCGGLGAQEARVRVVEKVSMPTQVDSNSPAFWRDGRLFWFGSHGRPWLSEGRDQFGPWETREVSLETANAWPHWMESVWPEDNGVLWGWYHCEPVGLFESSTLTAPKIGAVVSFDGGNTLRDLGIVLDAGDPLDPTAQNGYFAGGHGDFSVILDRDRTFFYFFFDNYGGPAESQGVCVARLAFADRHNPVGKVWKYYNGQWQEPGVGGRVTPIFPVQRRWQSRDPDAFWGPSVHWNTHLQSFVMLLNHAAGEPGWSQEGVYVSFAADLSRPESWKAPRQILDRSQFSGWYFFYPQVMGLEPGGTDRRAGQTARLYVGGISKWEIDFIAPPSAPVGVQATLQPAAPSLLPGEAATFTVTAAGSAPLTYQWFKDGIEIPRATSAVLAIPAATANDSGAYTVVVTNELGSTTSNPVTLTVQRPLPRPESFLSNLAVRSQLPAADTVLTVGFSLKTTLPKPLLVRAVGPTLGWFGIAGALADPRLEILDATSTTIGENDDWRSFDAETHAAAGAFPLPEGSADAALAVELPSGSGTAQVRGTGPGIVLVEIYDAAASAQAKIVNVSARGVVGTGEQVLIGGFTLSGTGSKRLLIRALGPQLAAYGVSNPLADPKLEIYDAADAKLAENDDWTAGLAPLFAAVGAPDLMPGSRDAALALTLLAGQRYTVVVRSSGDEVGEALLEIFEVP